MTHFTEAQKGTFKYTIAHNLAYNACAISLGHWCFRYLFHDLSKPWMLLWYKYIKREENPYAFVRAHHKITSSHHVQYPGKLDAWGWVIDQESSTWTKPDHVGAWLKYTQIASTLRPDQDEAIKKVIEQLGL